MRAGIILFVVFAITSAATAQQSRDPRIAYLFPAGGQAGNTFTVTIGGQNLDRPVGIHVSGGGVTAVVVDHFKPLGQGQAANLGDRLRELREKRQASKDATNATRPSWTEHDQQVVAAINRRMTMLVRKPSSPAMVESVTLQLTIAADATPGDRQLRLVTTDRVTNPMLFAVGQLPETTEKPSRLRDDPTQSVTGDAYTVTQPCVVNGQIMPGGVDRFRFSARKGQDLVILVRARELIPYISDAVPGWFQATATLLDRKGRQIAFGDDFQFHPDPVLHVKVPEDGEYTLLLRDAIYRGRDDFIYRVAIGELPFVTGAFPLGAAAGMKVPVQLTGWNLPAYRVMLDTAGRIPANYALFDLAPVRSTPTPVAPPWALQSIAVDTTADAPEREPNNLAAAAQTLSLPAIVNGRIDTPGDVDVFRIDARGGSPFVVEVEARRLGSPLDAAIDVTNAAGKLLATGDDTDDKAAGLVTHQADPRVPTTMPSDGVCYVRVRDVQAKGGPAHAYRLRVSEPRPDFELRVAPSSVNVRGKNGGAVTVYAIRRDGFTGDIEVSLDGAPAGIKLSATKIPADQDQLKLNIVGTGKLPDGPIPLRLRGEATTNGTRVAHTAVAAEDMMQAFAYRHLVPTDEFLACTGGRSDVLAERNAASIVARYVAEQLALPANRSPRFVSAYTAEREAAAIRLRTASPADRLTVALANERLMRNLLDDVLGPEQAIDAPAVLGPTLCDLDNELLPLVIMNVPREKLVGTLPVITKYLQSAAEKDARQNASRDLAALVGENAASYWANRTPPKMSTK